MGRVKIAKKSTFIDMTAMSDVTVLLLTFFMLTSTFLNKEPAQVITPPSVSELKVQETNFLQVLVTPDAKVWITLHGDTAKDFSTEAMRGKLLQQVAQLYNEQHSNKISFNDKQVAAFAKLNTFGVPLQFMGDFLNLAINDKQSGMTQQDKWLDGSLGKPTGIPISWNKDKNRPNEFQMWMKAARMVANDTGAPLAAQIKEGTGVAIKADANTSFEVVHMVMDNLQTINLNKFTLLTALKEGGI